MDRFLFPVFDTLSPVFDLMFDHQILVGIGVGIVTGYWLRSFVAAFRDEGWTDYY